MTMVSQTPLPGFLRAPGLPAAAAVGTWASLQSQSLTPRNSGFLTDSLILGKTTLDLFVAGIRLLDAFNRQLGFGFNFTDSCDS